MKEQKSDFIVDEKTFQTTPEDGFVDARKIKPHVSKDGRSNRSIASFHKGYSKRKTFYITDPRVVSNLAYGIMSIFLFISIFLLISKNYFFGIIFSIFTFIGFYGVIKDTNKKKEEFKKQNNNSSKPEKTNDQLKKETIEMVVDAKEDIEKTVLTKEAGDWFVKTGIIFCGIIDLFLFLFFLLLGGIVFAIFILIIAILSEIFSLWFISKLFKN